MNRKIVILFIGLLPFFGCREKDLDMTLIQKTVFEDATITAITVKDAWNVTVVQDEQTYVELEYSAFLEEYLRVTMEASELKIGFSQLLFLPGNTVKRATIHTTSVEKLHFSEAVDAVLEGDFPETSLLLELSDASSCKGGNFVGNAELKLGQATKLVDFNFSGVSCVVELDDASVFKGTLNIDESLNIKVGEASRMTTYGGHTPHAEVKVSDASLLNMLETEVGTMHITVKAASEASVFVTNALEGSVKDASKLYYKGNPTLNVDCDEASIIRPL